MPHNGAEAPGHSQKQLTQILIVTFLHRSFTVKSQLKIIELVTRPVSSSQQESSSQPSPAKQVPPPAKRSAAASSKSSMSQSDASATQVQDEQVQQQQHGTCRRVHGQERKDLWCSQCKNKQACSRWMREIQSLEDDKINKDASFSPPAQSATNKGVSQQPKATLPILGGSSRSGH